MAVEFSMKKALELWRNTLVDSVRADGPDLSARQMAILMIVYSDEPPHTVRGLAAKLNISKPAITRALDTMGRLDFTRRKRDETDRRSILVQRTLKGALYLSDFADLIKARAAAL